MSSKIVFLDREWSWNTDTLFDFVYTYGNVPLLYKSFFYRDDIIACIKSLSDQLAEIAKTKTIYPPLPLIFRSLREYAVNPSVVIIGQDPYHNPGSAMGLCFSLPSDVERINPSMQNIQKELTAEGFTANSGNLIPWSKQGVLLLNASLTVEQSDAGSHTEMWADSKFTEKLIEYISSTYKLAWLLFGNDAQCYAADITNKTQHCILQTSHPSPLSATKGRSPFMGSNVFNNCNAWLKQNKLTPINWNIE